MLALHERPGGLLEESAGNWKKQLKMAVAVTAAATAGVLAVCNERIGGPSASTCSDCGNGTRLKVAPIGVHSVMVQMNEDPPVTRPAVIAAWRKRHKLSGARVMRRWGRLRGSL
jgi:hypothetical protein